MATHLPSTGPVAVSRSEPDSLLTDQEVSIRLGGVSTGTLAVWRSTRRYALPFVKIGKLVRYRRADVESFIASRLVGG